MKLIKDNAEMKKYAEYYNSLTDDQKWDEIFAKLDLFDQGIYNGKTIAEKKFNMEHDKNA